MQLWDRRRDGVYCHKLRPLIISHPWFALAHPAPNGDKLGVICEWILAEIPAKDQDKHPVFLYQG